MDRIETSCVNDRILLDLRCRRLFDRCRCFWCPCGEIASNICVEALDATFEIANETAASYERIGRVTRLRNLESVGCRSGILFSNRFRVRLSSRHCPRLITAPTSSAATIGLISTFESPFLKISGGTTPVVLSPEKSRLGRQQASIRFRRAVCPSPKCQMNWPRSCHGIRRSPQS
jgi:hypothetical protein